MAQPLRISVEVTGTGEVFALLDRLEISLTSSSLRYFLEKSVWPVYLREIEERFVSHGDSTVGRWRPLRAATLDIKERLGVPYPSYQNIRTGELLDFVTRGQRSHISLPTEGGAELTFPREPDDPVTLRKFLVAQMGSQERNWLNPAMGPTPPRPVIGINPNTDMVRLIKLLSVHVVEYMTGAGGLG